MSEVETIARQVRLIALSTACRQNPVALVPDWGCGHSVVVRRPAGALGWLSPGHERWCDKVPLRCPTCGASELGVFLAMTEEELTAPEEN